MSIIEYLTVDSSTLLPSSSVWETAGGSEELATAIFLRGCIIGSFGLIETKFNDIAIRSSKIPEFHKISLKAPRTIFDRLEFVKSVFKTQIFDEFVFEHGPDVVDKVLEKQGLRNKWAHGSLSVLPGMAGQRWNTATIELTNFEPKANRFDWTIKKYTGLQIQELALSTKSLADEVNLIHCKIGKFLPEISRNSDTRL